MVQWARERCATGKTTEMGLGVICVVGSAAARCKNCSGSD